MSPVTHGMFGWVISNFLENRRDRIIVTIASLIPDIDGIGIIYNVSYYTKYHHILGHNLFLFYFISFVIY